MMLCVGAMLLCVRTMMMLRERTTMLCVRTMMLCICIMMLCICTTVAHAGAQTRVAVLPLRESAAGAATARLEAALADALPLIPGVTAVNLANGKFTSPRKGEGRLESQPSARAVALGRELGAQRAVAVEATPLGDGLVIYVQALEVPSGRSLGSTTFALSGGAAREPGDLAAARAALTRVIDPALYIGRLDIKLDVQGAEVQVDGRPARSGIVELPVGTHALRVTHPAYHDFLRFLDVGFDQTLPVAVNMAAYPLAEGEMTESQRRGLPINTRKLPWYRRWYSVVGAGIVLTGVTLGVVWLARPGVHDDSSATFKPVTTP